MQQAGSKQLVSYTPKLDGKKWVTDVTTGKMNGGIYRQEEFKKAIRMLLDCAHNLPNPRLFHVCLTGADIPLYQLVIKRLCRELKFQNFVTRYRGAIEYDQTNGEHCHLYIILSSQTKQTALYITAQDESKNITTDSDSSLLKVIKKTLTKCPTLKYRVNVPQQQNHNPSVDNKPIKTVAFLQFNKTNQFFFDNVVEWMSYAYKARSKQGGACYLSDKQNKRAKLIVKSFVDMSSDDTGIYIRPINSIAACLHPL